MKKEQSILSNFPKYDNFTFLYPPRPEYKVPVGEIGKYDTGEYVAQPKYNGSCCMVFTNGTELKLYNRQGIPLSRPDLSIEFLKLAPKYHKNPNWFVYAGEYLNKGKLGETGEKERNKYIIWDVLVWDGKYLIGSTFEERLTLLEKFIPSSRASVGKEIEMYEHLCCSQFKGIYKVPTYMDGFADLYSELVKTDLYEGLVMKKKLAKLNYGYQEINNADWQLKCRKETKNYRY